MLSVNALNEFSKEAKGLAKLISIRLGLFLEDHYRYFAGIYKVRGAHNTTTLWWCRC